MHTTPIKRALLSVSNKDGLAEFAKALVEQGVEIISTGGTSKALQDAGIPYREVEDLTKLPEMLGGRVKTLHPAIHGGILGKRDQQADEAKALGLDWIDLVVVNFYPFLEATSGKDMSWDEAVEYIDIGGPTMVRAAAKNFVWVGVVVNPSDYSRIIDELKQHQGLTQETRLHLAEKAFAATLRYDMTIHQYFLMRKPLSDTTPEHLSLHFKKLADLRYGENPHQRASAYQLHDEKAGVLSAAQHQGKPLSYNNILDAEAAWTCLHEFEVPTCVIIKHANPCGVASAPTINEAYAHAYAADPLSAYGGVVAINQACTKEIADALASIYIEVVLAPDYSPEALEILTAKPNMRVLEVTPHKKHQWEMKFITGGLLLQEKNHHVLEHQALQTVTKSKPTAAETDAMLFAWRVLKHIKSNGILIAKGHATLGIGAGQVSRVDAVDIALRKAGDKVEGAVLASDAFFPFRDSIDHLAQSGIKAIIQPGGSVRDDEVIAACNEHGIAMVFTGKRCFRH